MRILLVLDQFDGANNGNTNSARRLRETLIRHGHEVRVAAEGDSRPDDKYGFPLYHLPIFDKLVTAQGFTFASRDRAKMKEAVAWADVVHVMMPFALGRSAALEAGRQNKFHVLRIQKIRVPVFSLHTLSQQYDPQPAGKAQVQS